MSEDPLIKSLTAALAGRPDDLPLRLHLGDLLLGAGRTAEAIAHAGLALSANPGDLDAQNLMNRALTAQAAGTAQAPGTLQGSGTAPTPGTAQGSDTAQGSGGAETRDRPADPNDPLAAYEHEFSEFVPPRFVDRTDPTHHRDRADRADAAGRATHAGGEPDGRMPTGDEPEPVRGDLDRMFDVADSAVRLADVGGMTAVKERLELAFLGPLRHPELRRLYGKSLRGGLLLYGPPGCGKTFLARAVAGEMGAKFASLSIVDVLDMWLGNSERNLHQLFQAARRNAPCVLFLDEIDALGHKRSKINSSSMRTVGNQLLAELDGMDGNNDGVFVLAATNTPWDVDEALRRPGRLDRMVLVLPPDAEARATILALNLRDRPIAGIDLAKLVTATADFSGADLAHLCETAAEFAMADSLRTGSVRMIEQRDFDRALRELRPSTGPWFATARNVAAFANEGGAYDDLVAYLKKRKLL